MSFKSILAAALVVFAAGSAGAEVWYCEFAEQGNSGWIPKQLLLTIDDTSGEITVRDPVSEYYKGHPLPARLSLENAKRRTWAWVMDDFKVVNGGKAQYVSGLRYRMTLFKGSDKARIWADPNGYRNQFQGKGSCRKRG